MGLIGAAGSFGMIEGWRWWLGHVTRNGKKGVWSRRGRPGRRMQRFLGQRSWPLAGSRRWNRARRALLGAADARRRGAGRSGRGSSARRGEPRCTQTGQPCRPPFGCAAMSQFKQFVIKDRPAKSLCCKSHKSMAKRGIRITAPAM